MTDYVMTYASPAEMVTLCDTPCLYKDSVAVLKDTDSFYGQPWPEVKELVTCGWADGARQIHQGMIQAAQFTGQAKTQERYLDVAGMYPDVFAACAGQPENMVNLQYGQDIQRKIIKMIVNISVTNTFDTKHVLNRGAAILSVIDGLEQAGHRVELHVSRDASSSNIGVFMSCLLKRANDPLNLEQAAFFLMRKEGLRRLFFGAGERDKDFAEHSHGGYAPIGAVTDVIKTIYGQDGDYVYIPGGKDEDDYATPELATKKIMSLISTQSTLFG